jgi:hypothetical protein
MKSAEKRHQSLSATCSFGYLWLLEHPFMTVLPALQTEQDWYLLSVFIEAALK